MKRLMTCAAMALMTLVVNAQDNSFCIAKDGKAATSVVPSTAFMRYPSVSEYHLGIGWQMLL